MAIKNSSFQKGEIVIYESKEGPRLEVRLREDTVWLTQKQMAELLDKDVRTINEHIKNIFSEGELNESLVIRKFRITANDGKNYETNFYNLDVIISVGYRVKSIRGTQFRIWATNTLKEHLVKGYTLNETRLLQYKNSFQDLQETIALLQEKSKHDLLAGQEQEILSLISSYSKTLTLLEQYDKEKLILAKKAKEKYVLKYVAARKLIDEIKKSLIAKNEASNLFGQESGDNFKAILKNIYQTFDNKELYSSMEEKAAHLLYLIIKDHPFVDGNKRIASFLFVYYLDKNNYLHKMNGEKKINDNALTALALLIAVSDPKEKDKFIRLTTNLLAV